LWEAAGLGLRAQLAQHERRTPALVQVLQVVLQMRELLSLLRPRRGIAFAAHPCMSPTRERPEGLVRSRALNALDGLQRGLDCGP
jgi:hypothetical protein